MKITMKNGEEKGGSSHHNGGNCSAPNKFRIAVFGQHDVGKSALTVRFLTKRYIGEYKSNTDLLYRQTLAISHGSSLDIEIVDISTSSEGPDSTLRKTFPVEELHRADSFVIVYSITDRSSFSTALEALTDIQNCYNIPAPSNINAPTTSQSSCPPTTTKPYVHIALIANKSDLEHLRCVDKTEGIAASLQYGCQFYELSVAENSPEVYTCFQSIITGLIAQSLQPPPKRKFSVSKMLGNLRLGGRNSPSNSQPIPTSPASIVDTNVVTNESSPSSPAKSRESSPGFKKGKHERQGSGDSTASNISNSICHLKSKLVELHSMKKRHNSPPICSL